MKSLAFAGPGRLEWRETPDARVRADGEAVVRPLVIGRCDLDIGLVRGLVPMPVGAPLGHEIIGEITEVGDRVDRFEPGDRVVVPAQISCGSCRQCARGFTGRCQSVPFAASYGMGRAGDFGGGAADLVRVPYADAMLVALPAGADPVDWIGFTDMAQDGYRAVGPQLRERPGARVLVIGGLPAVIGIYAAGLAVACGAGSVDFYDDDPVRLAEAARYGATPIDRSAREPEGLYEIVVDSSIAPAALIEAFRFAEPEGLVTSVGIHFGETAAAPFMESYHKGVTYRTGRPNCRQHMEAVRDLCCSGAFAPQRIATKFFDFDDGPAAWMDDALRTACVRRSSMPDPVAIASRFITGFLGKGDVTAADRTAHARIQGITGPKPGGAIDGREEHQTTIAGFGAILFDETHVMRIEDGLIIENIVSATNLEFEMLRAPVLAPLILSQGNTDPFPS